MIIIIIYFAFFFSFFLFCHHYHDSPIPSSLASYLLALLGLFFYYFWYCFFFCILDAFIFVVVAVFQSRSLASDGNDSWSFLGFVLNWHDKWSSHCHHFQLDTLEYSLFFTLLLCIVINLMVCMFFFFSWRSFTVLNKYFVISLLYLVPLGGITTALLLLPLSKFLLMVIFVCDRAFIIIDIIHIIIIFIISILSFLPHLYFHCQVSVL